MFSISPFCCFRSQIKWTTSPVPVLPVPVLFPFSDSRSASVPVLPVLVLRPFSIPRSQSEQASVREIHSSVLTLPVLGDKDSRSHISPFSRSVPSVLKCRAAFRSQDSPFPRNDENWDSRNDRGV